MRFATIALLLASVAASAADSITNVSAASFGGNTFAPGSIVTAFGTNLAATTESAGTGALPTTLAGVSVNVVDKNLQLRPAALLYASPTQINYVIPEDVPVGRATMSVVNGTTVNGTGQMTIASVSPALFTANRSGLGLAAARAVTEGSSVDVFDCATAPPGCRPVPVPVTAGQDTYLELYGTGIRGRSAVSAVTAAAGGATLDVLYAGPQSQYAGLDQVNVRVPVALAQAGLVTIQLTVDGVAANPVLVQFGGSAAPASVSVLFNPADPDTGPFPTDFLTVADSAQNNGRRINLPLPDCAVQKTTCDVYNLLNQYDGFDLMPRIRVRFSGPVDIRTLPQGIQLVPLDPAASAIAAARVIYDSNTNTAYAEPANVLDQRRRYALVVTDAVHDLLGNPVAAAPEFTSCATDYCRTLPSAVTAGHVVAESVFTTMSATAWLERAAAATAIAPDVQRVASIDLGNYASATLRRQTGADPVAFDDFSVALPAVIAAGTEHVYFGKFASPNYLDARQIIPESPTATAPLVPRAANSITFHAFVPGTSKPAGGYPVVIFGHGLGDSSFGAPTLVAGTFARRGFVTLAVNAVGHGSGPRTELVLTDYLGNTRTIPVPGRGMDLNADGLIGSREGCLIDTLGIALRDCLRQTTVDLAQLVRAVPSIDLDGDGLPDLDANRIYYAGQSLGALYGTLFTAVEPLVRAAALNVGGATVVDIAELSDQLKPLARDILAEHTPPLLNLPSDFDANPVLPGQPPRVNDVAGAIEIQKYLARLQWLQEPGDPMAYAQHLARAPLGGRTAKRLLFQIARGDRTVPNPTNANLIRAAGGENATVLYRADVAKQYSAGLADNPHAFLVDERSPAGIGVALAAQDQIAGFFATDGTEIPDANSTALNLLFLGHTVFERPATLPQDLGY